MLQPGEVLGGMYQVIREIGKGGVGIIYLGYHLRLQKQVVIKKVKDNVAGRINVRAEADILKNLHHTFLPQVYDFLEANGGIYTVMEYIPGENLQYYIDRRYMLPEETVRSWLIELCAVLEYLHTRRPRILHSDIKPANIMVTPEGKIVLIDFNVSLSGEATDDLQGISRVYAAPEQYRAAMDKLSGRPPQVRVDERMDLYSLAAVFYHLMSGVKPDAERGVPAPLTKMRLNYSQALRSVLDKAMSRDPKRRYKNAAEMGDALRNLEKMDPEYRKLGKLQIITGFSGAAVMLIGIFLLMSGWNLHVRDVWIEEYNEFAAMTEEMADADDAQEVIEYGEDILNDILLQGYRNSNPDATAGIANAIGEAYFLQEKYASAASYFEYALEYDDSRALYLRNYMTARILDGNTVDVDAVLAQYPDSDISTAEIYYVNAASLYMDGYYDEALDACAQAVEETADSEVLSAAYLLEVWICYETGDIEAAANAAILAAQYGETPEYTLVAAGMAEEAAIAASEAGDNAAFLEWVEVALGYYEVLCDEEDADYDVRLEYAVLLYLLGEYEDSVSALKTLCSEDEEDYYARMWICFDYIGIYARDGSLSAVESDLTFYYSAAEQLYLKSGEENEYMEELSSEMALLGLD